MATKPTFFFLTAAIFAATPALPDGLTERGLDDPEVSAPARDWTGVYFGVATRRNSTTTENVECYKLGQVKDCNDPIFLTYPEFKVEVITTSTETQRVNGLLVGGWYDMGRVVPGVDVAFYDGETIPGINLGLDLGGVLPYAHYDRHGAALGVQAKVSPRLNIGFRISEDGGAITGGWSF